MTVLINNSRERSRFLRFAFVGIVGAVVDFGVSNLLIKLFTYAAGGRRDDLVHRRHPQQLHLEPLLDLPGFALQADRAAAGPVRGDQRDGSGDPHPDPVFPRAGDGSRWRSDLDLQILPVLDAKTLADNFTLAIAVIIVMFWNFFANRYWTYNDVE